MKFCRIIFCLWLLVCFFPIGIHADIQLPSILSDNMVLQQNAKVRFWGKARPGERILVKTSWDHKKYKVTALANGHWELMIQTPAATSGQSVMLKGDNKIRINNILIGEVWLCTGQSNMEFPVARNPQVKWKTGMLNEAEEMKDADFPEIRLFHVEHQLAPDDEKEDCVGKWVVCNPENLKDFSAVGFVFGRKLYKELSTPVGLIQSTWGGTHAESWTSMKVMENNPLYADVLKQYSKEKVSREKDKCKVPATLWNGMIAPMVGYTVKGNIWYQGESNSVRYEKYQEVFTNLINSWRKEWNQPDMPFYFVQIAPHYKQPAGIREAQLKTWLSGLENIGMAVVTDAADSTDIHPRNKVAPGERLAAWALAKQYGKKIVYSGPLYKSMKVNGREITLDFAFAEGGLQTPGNEPVKGFFIAGNDARFYPADAVINGSSITLSSTYVSAPVAVRYGYGTFFRVNLFNKAGLPAVPFRTDTFAPDTYYRLFADSEIRRFPEAWQLDHGKRLYFGYAQGVGCCAMLQVWKKTGDRRYFDYVEAWADSLVDDKGEIHLYKKETYNLDYINSGKVLFDLYNETKKEKYKLAIENLIDQLKKQPRTTDGGFWHKKIYPNQMWLDGLYMASPFMARYGAEFNRPEWIDEAVKQFTLCHQHTYDTKTGLYYHAWNEDRSQRWADPETGHSPNFWGRSIGWWFMALVDALEYIPQDHSGYADMIKWTKELAETLSKYQDKNGLWYQVIDQPSRTGNFPEASVTTQCMYAYMKAVNKGYIDSQNASFEVKFDVDFPYAESNDYVLDITLGFYDETYDDGSSGPYVNGNVSVYTYYQWTDITSAQTVYCDFILGVRYNSTQKEYWYSKDFEQNLFIDKNGMLVNNVNWLDKTVRLPDGDDIGYKLFLLTEIWAKLYSSIGVMSGETEVSWYSVYYRNKENDGEYSEWYPADELDTSLAWVDATIDFYSNLEIVCFKTKEIQDAYASQWGIVPYN